MAKITREEVLKIAKMSHLQLHEQEIDPLINQLQAVLSYAERVKDIATSGGVVAHKAINQWREDVVIPTDADRVLAEAPEAQEHYFVVPRILENQ